MNDMSCHRLLNVGDSFAYQGRQGSVIELRKEGTLVVLDEFVDQGTGEIF